MFEDRSFEGPPFRYCVEDILTQLFGHSCYGNQYAMPVKSGIENSRWQCCRHRVAG